MSKILFFNGIMVILMSIDLDEHEYLSESKQPMHIRMISEQFFEDNPIHQQIEVILDSGADSSLLPFWLAKEG